MPPPLPPTREGHDMHLNLLFSIQRELGVLQEGQRAMMAGVERLRIETHSRADRIEQSLWQLQRAPASPTTASTAPRSALDGLLAVLQQITAILKLLLPIAFVATVVAVKILHPDLLPLVRKMLAGL